MKTLTLSLFLTLPMMAQPPLKELPAPAKSAEMTNLLVDEQNSLAIAFFNYYEARIAVLEALAASKAGNTEINRVQSAQKSLTDLLAKLRSDHNTSSPECVWDFPSKKWSCPAVK